MKCCVFILVASCVFAGEAARILGVFPVPGKSHYMAGAALMRILAEAGHEVTVISPFGEKDPPKNYRDVVLTEVKQQSEDEKEKFNMFDMADSNPLVSSIFFTHFILKKLGPELGDPAFKKFMAENQKFDIVIIEQFMSDFLKFLPWKLDAHLVLFSAVDASFWTNPFVCNPAPSSYVPDVMTPYTDNMAFFERTFNFIFAISNQLLFNFYALPAADQFIHEHYPDAPPLSNLVYNTSLVFLNGDLSVGFASPKVPNMVSIGGYHIQEPKKLPKDLKELLDSSTNGLVYFSLGSNLQSKDMPKEYKDMFLRVFAKLKQTVLWKFEDDSLGDLPKNVHLRKWLPQQDILAHKNVKLFITHGGIFSTMEAVYFGVPLLAIPVIGEQKRNSKRSVQNGYALMVNLKTIEERDFESKVMELLTNPKYRENVKERSRIIRDQIVSPKEKIKYWIDYVIRHKGAHHLQVAGIKLPWYQYHMLDVMAFLAVIIFVTFKALLLLTKTVLNCFRKKSIKKKKQ